MGGNGQCHINNDQKKKNKREYVNAIQSNEITQRKWQTYINSAKAHSFISYAGKQQNII